MQLALFEDLPTFHGFKCEHGAHWLAGNYHCRNWRGFYQTREIGATEWCFVIYAFGGEPEEWGTASVYVVDEDGELQKQDVPIDPTARLFIHGHYFGRSRWVH